MSSNKTAYPVGFSVGRHVFRRSKKYSISEFLINTSRNRRKLSQKEAKKAINKLNRQPQKSSKLPPNKSKKPNKKKLSRLKKNILHYHKTIRKRGIHCDPIEALGGLLESTTISNVQIGKLHHNRFRR